MTDERTSPRLRALKTCPICSAEFGCAEGGAGCWCETMMLSPPDLAEIRAFTEACLCPRCLSGFAERDAA
ncbi:MAG: hypothetical protein E6G46_11805, partial [Actinobacteria bacterium]